MISIVGVAVAVIVVAIAAAAVARKGLEAASATLARPCKALADKGSQLGSVQARGYFSQTRTKQIVHYSKSMQPAKGFGQ